MHNHKLRHSPFLSCFLVVTLAGDCYASSQRIILEGFQNAKIGFEIECFNLEAKALATVGAYNNNFIQMETSLFAGRAFHHDSTTEIVASLGTNFTYSGEGRSIGSGNWACALDPAAALSLYKFFGHVLIGGSLMFDIWEFQKYSSGAYGSGWFGVRRLDVDPHFIIGYAF
jgi:hypothetical protein